MFTSAAEVTFVEGTIFVRFLPGIGVEVGHAAEIADAVGKLSGGRHHGNIVDARELLFMSDEARRAFAGFESKGLSGVALVVDSRVQRLMAQLYLTAARPAVRTGVFSDLDGARRWLNEPAPVAERAAAR